MRRAQLIAWGVGVGGLIAAALGWVFQPALFRHAWLAAFVFWSEWPLGAMGLLLVHAITGGRWGDLARPGLVLGVLTLPLMIPAVVPVVLEWGGLYPWLHSEAAAAAHLGNLWYLNLGAFIGRNVAYAVIWFVIAGLVVFRVAPRLVAPPALILLGVTITFAAFDTTMSLDPRFRSSIYGMIAGADAAVFAMAIATLLAVPALGPLTLPEPARVLCGLCFLWTWVHAIQLIVIWTADLADEAPYLLFRIEGFWGGIYAAIMLGHALVAGFLLLIPRLRRNPAVVAGIALFLIVLHLVGTWWAVLPFVPRAITWVDIACMAGMGGIAAALALTLFARPVLLRRLAGMPGAQHA